MGLFSIDEYSEHCDFWLYTNYLLFMCLTATIGFVIHHYMTTLRFWVYGSLVWNIIFMMSMFFQNRLLYSMCKKSLV